MEELPPTDGQVPRGGKPPLGVWGVWRTVRVSTNTGPLLVFMPLITSVLGKGTECFLQAWIRLFLIKMH